MLYSKIYIGVRSSLKLTLVYSATILGSGVATPILTAMTSTVAHANTNLNTDINAQAQQANHPFLKAAFTGERSLSRQALALKKETKDTNKASQNEQSQTQHTLTSGLIQAQKHYNSNDTLAADNHLLNQTQQLSRQEHLHQEAVPTIKIDTADSSALPKLSNPNQQKTALVLNPDRRDEKVVYDNRTMLSENEANGLKVFRGQPAYTSEQYSEDKVIPNKVNEQTSNINAASATVTDTSTTSTQTVDKTLDIDLASTLLPREATQLDLFSQEDMSQNNVKEKLNSVSNVTNTDSQPQSFVPLNSQKHNQQTSRDKQKISSEQASDASNLPKQTATDNPVTTQTVKLNETDEVNIPSHEKALNNQANVTSKVLHHKKNVADTVSNIEKVEAPLTANATQENAVEVTKKQNQPSKNTDSTSHIVQAKLPTTPTDKPTETQTQKSTESLSNVAKTMQVLESTDSKNQTSESITTTQKTTATDASPMLINTMSADSGPQAFVPQKRQPEDSQLITNDTLKNNDSEQNTADATKQANSTYIIQEDLYTDLNNSLEYLKIAKEVNTQVDNIRTLYDFEQSSTDSVTLPDTVTDLTDIDQSMSSSIEPINPIYLNGTTQEKLTYKLMEKAYKSTTVPTSNLQAFQNNIQHRTKTKTAVDKTNNSVHNTPRCSGYWVYPEQKTSDKPTDNSMTNGLHALADYGYYNNKNHAELVGNVRVQQGEQVINANKVSLDLTNQTAKAQGEVLFTDRGFSQSNKNASTKGDIKDSLSGGFVGLADTVDYNTAHKTAKAGDIAFASIPMQAHGYAKSLSKNNDTEYNLEDVIFSTCAPTDRKWQLNAKNIDLDTKTGRGKAQHTTLKIKDVPVLYMPYFNFPIDDRRTSGFLTPSFNYSSETDFGVSVPYYVNLAPNYDATVTANVFTDRNPMGTAEFRYLTEDYGQGRMIGSYLPSDKKYDNEDRSSVFYEHKWRSKSTPNLSAEVEYNYLSDSDYIDDFDYSGNIDNQLNVPSRASINYSNDNLDAQLKVESYQQLEATDLYGNRIEDKDRAYDRLPQLSVSYYSPSLKESLTNIGVIKADNQETENLVSDVFSNTLLDSQSILDKIQIDAEHDSAYFKKDITDGSAPENSGFRMYNKLSASYPYIKPWGHIHSKVNLQHLYATYDEDTRIANDISQDENSQSVFVPQVTIDAQANLIKEGKPTWLSPFIGSKKQSNPAKKSTGHQILSPRVKYSYAPFKNQNDIPNFTTQIASINHEQLYADSWFLGHDRLQDLHAITPGINYRYIDEMGKTKLDASIAEQYYLDEGQVSLDDNTQESSTNTSLFNNNSSGLVASLSAQPYDNLWVDVNSALTDDYDLNYITSQLRYQPTNDSQFSVGVVERKEDKNTNQLPISAVTGSAIFPVNNNWRVISQTQYDYDTKKFLETTLGLDYEDCCFGFALYGRRYYNDLNPTNGPTDAVMAEVRLNGLSDKSSGLNKLLSNKILDIDSVNNFWKRDFWRQ